MSARVPDAVLDAPGIACESLTPLMAKTISSLLPGAVLEVRTDDPGCREWIPKWCRETENRLFEAIEHDQQHTTFVIERCCDPGPDKDQDH